jgi:hypothetical protein
MWFAPMTFSAALDIVCDAAVNGSEGMDTVHFMQALVSLASCLSPYWSGMQAVMSDCNLESTEKFQYPAHQPNSSTSSAAAAALGVRQRVESSLTSLYPAQVTPLPLPPSASIILLTIWLQVAGSTTSRIKMMPASRRPRSAQVCCPGHVGRPHPFGTAISTSHRE